MCFGEGEHTDSFVLPCSWGRGCPPSAKEPQLLHWPSTLDFCQPLSKVKTLCLICGDVGVDNACVCTHFMEKSYFLCCASSKFYSCRLDLKKREYEDWRAVQTTCVSVPRPQQKQRSSCLSLVNGCWSPSSLGQDLMCFFVCFSKAGGFLQMRTISFLRCCNASI